MSKQKRPSARATVRALNDLRHCAASAFASEQSRLNPARWDEAIEAAKQAVRDREHLLWLIERARAIRTAKGWSAKERAVSWRDWDMHARIALGEVEGERHA